MTKTRQPSCRVFVLCPEPRAAGETRVSGHDDRTPCAIGPRYGAGPAHWWSLKGAKVDDLRVTNRVTIPARDLDVRVARSSGPGGQGVNTTDSKVELRFDLEGTECMNESQKALVRRQLGNRVTADGVLILQSNEHRSQHRNREAARERMRRLISEALVPPRPRRATKPTKGAKRRRIEAKRQRSDLKRQRQAPHAD